MPTLDLSTRKIGLALGSGGARGGAHLGVLQALSELGIRPLALLAALLVLLPALALASPPPACIPNTYWHIKDRYWYGIFTETASNAVCFVYEARPVDSSIPVSAARDQALAVMKERQTRCALASAFRDVEIRPEGDSRIVVDRSRRGRRFADPKYVHAILATPGRLSFRAVAPQNDAWAGTLFAERRAPEGCGIVSLPHGDFWKILPAPAAHRPVVPDVASLGVPPGCTPCLQRQFRGFYNNLYRPWLLLDAAPSLTLSRPAAVRVPDPAANRPHLEIDLSPADADALAALACGLAPGTRLAAVLDGNACAILSASPEMVGATLPLPFDAHDLEGLDDTERTDFFLDLAAILRSGPLPCSLVLVDLPTVPRATPESP